MGKKKADRKKSKGYPLPSSLAGDLENAVNKSTGKSVQPSQLRAALAGAYSGGPVSNHREEAFHFTDFSYVAIHAIGMQLHSASVTAYVDGSSQMSNQARRKSLRAKFGSYTRWKASYGEEEEEVESLDMSHPLMRLLARPNPYESGGTFRYRQAIQTRLTGGNYVWNVPSQLGPTCERYVIPTTAITPVFPSKKLPFGGYLIQPSCARFIPLNDDGFVEGSTGWQQLLGKVVDARFVQKCGFPHPVWLDDFQSPQSAGARWIDGERSINEARTSGVSQGMNPSMVWTLPEDNADIDQDTMDRTQKAIQDKYGGPQNVGRVLVAPFGTTVNQNAATPKDMGYDVGFQDMKAAVLALHNTPPVAIGMQEPGSRAAYYASLTVMDHAAVQPLCDMLAESDTFHLAPQFGVGITIEMESEKIDDADATNARLTLASNAKSITKNELRANIGMPPLPGPEGDEFAGPEAAKPTGQMPGQQNPNLENQSPQIPTPPPAPKPIENPFSKPETQSKTLLAALEGMDEADDEFIQMKLGGLIEKAVSSRLKSLTMAKFSSTQINLPTELAARIKAFGEMIPDSELADDGREDQIHVTVKYGLHTNNAEEVRPSVSSFGPVRIMLGETSFFQCDGYDVIKVDVISPQIVMLNGVVSDACEHTDTHPEYVPHCTIAYVASGLGEKYSGLTDFEGESFTADSIEFSNQNRVRKVISLTGKATKSLGMNSSIGADGGFTIQDYQIGCPPCPNCGSGNTNHVRTDGIANTVCQNCHLLFSDPNFHQNKSIPAVTKTAPRRRKKIVTPVVGDSETLDNPSEKT